jgi:chromosome segregation ATPase
MSSMSINGKEIEEEYAEAQAENAYNLEGKLSECQELRQFYEDKARNLERQRDYWKNRDKESGQEIYKLERKVEELTHQRDELVGQLDRVVMNR